MLSSTFFLSALLTHTSHAALYYPTPQIHLLEHILVDNWDAYASNFSSAITPCINYVTGTGAAARNSGRTTAAQWMRVLFHDMITANVSAGTGGVDASIGFETARAENKGSAFNDSFTFWRPFMNDAVSMADLIALGTVMSNNLCGGAKMPYRAGRVDATAAGVTTGVPAPETGLDETLLFFERAGFDKVDAIGLTACGHTLGSVHHGGFPEVVDDTFVNPNNTNGGSNFDTTRGVFDPNVVGEYLNWTGNKGGPLVTSHNDTMNSDLRLYESDKNATMRALFAQGTGFLDTCVDLMGRAIDTVPSGVQLGDPITPMPVKPINVTYDFGPDGDVVLYGMIRILTASDAAPPAHLNLHVYGHNSRLVPEAETGRSVFGTTTYFPFSLSGSTIWNTTSFTVSGSTISEHVFQHDSRIFIVPSMTYLNDENINATIAISKLDNCTKFKLSISTSSTQQGTLAPKMSKQVVELKEAAGSGNDYRVCTAESVLKGVPTGLVTLNVLAGEKVVDTLLVNGGNAGW